MAENHRPNLGFERDYIVEVQHGIFGVVADTLIKQIQVKHQSMPTSPYDTHKRVMSSFLAALFIYATASVAEVILRTQKSAYHRLVGNVRLVASALVIVFLLVVLAPVLGYCISVLWTCLFVTLAYETCQEFCQLLSRTYTDMLKKLSESVRSSKEEAS